MHDDISLEQDTSLPVDRSLLVVERDPMYVKRIVSIMEIRGYVVMCIASVQCIRLGAINYLPKPEDADEICSVLLGVTTGGGTCVFEVMSCRCFTWEYVWRTYELCGCNVSGSGRKLGIRRQSLQRPLSKRAPR